jgi:hypothetical protein
LTICPGEASCEIFASAGGKTHKARVKNACSRCEFLPTKTNEGKRSHRALEDLAETATYIRRRYLSGYPMTLNEVTAVEFEAYLMLETYTENKAMQFQHEIKAVLLAGFQLKVE